MYLIGLLRALIAYFAQGKFSPKISSNRKKLLGINPTEGPEGDRGNLVCKKSVKSHNFIIPRKLSTGL